jgi:negative regulator of sigma E activity
MTQRKWKDSDLSAYIDGELDRQTVQALTSSLAEDPELQQRLDEIREVSELVRAAPLREPPRNYLLTPSMVAEPEPETRARDWLRLPMWAMRLATSLTAAAFVITLSLSLFQGGLSPRGMMTEQADSQPQPEMMRLESEASPTAEIQATVEVQALEAEEAAPMEEEEAPADLPPTPTVPGTLTPQEEMALEAMPGGPEGEPQGLGGGEEPLAVQEEKAVERATEETDAADAPPPDAPRDDRDEAIEAVPEATPEARVEGEPEALEPPPPPPVEEPTRILGPERWRQLAVVMGALTAILGGVTFWTSRHRH